MTCVADKIIVGLMQQFQFKGDSEKLRGKTEIIE